jgi:mono/diheme cytochrome c family protein
MSKTFWWQIHGGSTHFSSGRILHRGLSIYLVGMSLAAVLMVGAVYSDGEMFFAAETGKSTDVSCANKPTSTPDQMAPVGQRLFLKNCVHCHGTDARGDEGPGLHNLDWTDEKIATRIRNGKKGQMTAFAGKFSADDIRAVIAYLRMLK